MWVIKIDQDQAYWCAKKTCGTDSQREATRYPERWKARYEVEGIARGRVVRLVPKRERRPVGP